MVVDTHVVLRFVDAPGRVGRRAVKILDRALHGRALGIAAVSFWELAMLTRKARIRMQVSPAVLRERLLAQGVREYSLDGAMGIVAGELPGLGGDPADRMIVATAMALDATLVTADESLLEWSGSVRMVDARN